MTDLLARLEAATEGSRELDYQIARRVCPDMPQAVNADKAKPFDWIRGGRYRSEDVGSVYREQFNQPAPPQCWRSPDYTTSIDAALTLVPDGAGLLLLIFPDGTASAAIGRPPQLSEAIWPTPALALCIAALKAREADQ